MPPDSTNFLRHLFDPSQWNLLAVLGVVASIISAIIAILPYLKRRRLRSLAEFYTADAIKRATDFYVESDCQERDPAFDHPDSNAQHPSRSAVFGVIDAMLEDPDKNKFILLLGDTGIGKTSFVINYFIRCLRQRKKFRLCVIPLSRAVADETIKKVRRKSETVLFLDALDEDHRAIGRIEQRVSELCQLAGDFRSVLITCRSQFFPREIEIPEEAGVVRIDPVGLGEQKGFTFQKRYLTPFSSAQIEAFLAKKYPLENERQAARTLVERIEHLAIRPLILSYLDYLRQNPATYKSTAQLYEAIIQAWLDRERGLLGIHSATPLRRFCENLALELSRQREAYSTERLPYEEVAKLAEKLKIDIDTWKLTGRSLLNRDAQDNFKFAHRSFQEYLFVTQCLAVSADQRPKVLWTAQMHRFLWEILQYCNETHKPLAQPLEQVVDLAEFTRTISVKFERIHLRPEAQTLSQDAVRQMLSQKGFYDRDLNKSGRGIAHFYVLYERNQEKVVIDHATGLMWQQGGSDKHMDFAAAREYIKQLNRQKFAGYSDWRLPTLEEAMSLMEPEKKNGDLYIDPVFDKNQRWIWTADKEASGGAWVVSFGNGYCYHSSVRGGNGVRAVRSGQS